MENNTNNTEIPTAITRDHVEVIDLHTFACNGDETLLGLRDAEDREFVIHFSTHELLKTLDGKTIEYMKEQLTKYIKGL